MMKGEPVQLLQKIMHDLKHLLDRSHKHRLLNVHIASNDKDLHYISHSTKKEDTILFIYFSISIL